MFSNIMGKNFWEAGKSMLQGTSSLYRECTAEFLHLPLNISLTTQNTAVWKLITSAPRCQKRFTAFYVMNTALTEIGKG